MSLVVFDTLKSKLLMIINNQVDNFNENQKKQLFTDIWSEIQENKIKTEKLELLKKTASYIINYKNNDNLKLYFFLPFIIESKNIFDYDFEKNLVGYKLNDYDSGVITFNLFKYPKKLKLIQPYVEKFEDKVWQNLCRNEIEFIKNTLNLVNNEAISFNFILNKIKKTNFKCPPFSLLRLEPSKRNKNEEIELIKAIVESGLSDSIRNGEREFLDLIDNAINRNEDFYKIIQSYKCLIRYYDDFNKTLTVFFNLKSKNLKKMFYKEVCEENLTFLTNFGINSNFIAKLSASDQDLVFKMYQTNSNHAGILLNFFGHKKGLQFCWNLYKKLNNLEIIEKNDTYQMLKLMIHDSFKNSLYNYIEKPRSAKEIHDWLAKNSFDKNEYDLNQIELDKIKNRNYKMFKLTVPEKNSDLKKMGNDLSICLGNGSYGAKVKMKESFIFIIEKNHIPKFCVELDSNFNIIQQKGFKNRPIPLFLSFIIKIITIELKIRSALSK